MFLPFRKSGPLQLIDSLFACSQFANKLDKQIKNKALLSEYLTVI